MNIVSKIFVAGVGILVVSGLTLAVQASSISMKNGRTVTGKSIEWREGTRDYLVLSEGASIPVPEDQVAKMAIDKPLDLDQAKNMVASRQYQQALPLLDAIIKQYRKLSWDIDAMRLSAQCFIEMNDSKKAADAVDALFVAGGTLPPVVQMSYWKSLQKSGDIQRLQKELSRTMGTGSPDLAAAAYLIRGNMYMEDGNQDAALSDFIKIIIFFKDEKAVQPEALYNAAELMDKAKDPRAADLRKTLVQNYKNSEFAAKVVPNKK